MFSLLKCNRELSIVPSNKIEQRGGCSVFENSQIQVLCKWDDEELLRSLMKNLKNNLPTIVLKPYANVEPERTLQQGAVDDAICLNIDDDDDSVADPNYEPTDEECDWGSFSKNFTKGTRNKKPTLAETLNSTSLGEFPTNYQEYQRNVGQDASAKKYFCVYCKQLYCKLVVHLEQIHSSEPEVRQFSGLPKGCIERKKLIESIRKKGCFEYNSNQCYNKGDIIVSRRSRKSTKRVNDYKICPNCKGYYSKYAIRKHYPKCIPGHDKGDRSLHIMGKLLNGQIHAKASEVLRKVFALLRDDDITRIIRYDELVIVFGNTLCEKYRLPHLHKMIRSKLRTVGRFLKEIKAIDKRCNNYTSVFTPENFDIAMRAVNVLGGLDPIKQEYASPATATDMGFILKKCSKLLITLCIKSKNEAQKRNVEDFLKLLEEELPTFVNKPAMETRLQQIRRKKIVLPVTEDVSKLYNYIEENVRKYSVQLKNKFSCHIWKELASFSLTLIQLFNRKRAGEIERITIEDFNTHQSINGMEVGNLIGRNDNFQSDLTNYVRFLIRGKKARGVPVLLSLDMLQAVKLIVKHRTEAGVPEENPYVFGIRGNSSVFTHLSACNLMRRFSVESGADRPELLRGTKLRKHLATQSALLDLKECEINDLANFMGHADKVHRDHYRIPVAAREIGRVSQLLEIGIGKSPCENRQKQSEFCKAGPSTSAQSSSPSLFESPQENETEIDENTSDEDSWREENLEGRTEYGRERCVSPRHNTKRKSWNKTEIKCANGIFQEHIVSKEAPSLLECKRAIESHNDLSSRSPSQLKAWVLNQMNKNKYQSRKTKERWNAEEIDVMQTNFHKHIKHGILPGLKFCEEVQKKNPVLKKRNAPSIKAWVNNTIKRDKKTSVKM